jgi:hypothetical protein
VENTSAILSLDETGKTKIGQFEYKLLVEENIFGFDISMRVALGVHVVEAVHHLVEVGSGDEFGELACVGDEIKELSAAHVFENDGKALVSRFILFFVGGVLSYSHKLDQVLVVKVFHDTELMLQH